MEGRGNLTVSLVRISCGIVTFSFCPFRCLPFVPVGRHIWCVDRACVQFHMITTHARLLVVILVD